MKTIKSTLIIIVICLLSIGAYFYILIARPNNMPEETLFVVEKGSIVRAIVSKLADEGYISDPLALQMYLKLRGWDRFIAGSHLLPPHASIIQIARTLAFGKAVNTDITIRIIEGWNKYEIARYLEDNTSIFAMDFLEETSTVSDNLRARYAFLSSIPQSAGLEGFLYPDTYRVLNDATAKDVVIMMLDNFERKYTDDLRMAVSESKYSLFQLVTLASIVEHEAASSNERRMVADVFLKRLDIGMPLQSDATVNYVTGKSDLQPLFIDTAIENPYNTYHNRGLPPGPISNPYIDSIESVIKPTPNPYYYFLTDKNGNMVYSRTGEEHLTNKRKYLDI